MDDHQLALENLCYVCGSVIKSRGQLIEGSLLEDLCELYQNNILELDIKRGVAPKKTCFKCCINSKRILTRKRDNLSFRVTNWPRKWEMCTLNIETCTTCSLYGAKGRPRKERKQLSDVLLWDVKKIPKSTYKKTYITRQSCVDDFLKFNRQHLIEKYSCAFCSNIVLEPLMLTCCNKLACYNCFVSYIEGKAVDDTQCCACKQVIDQTTPVLNSFVEDVLDSLRVPCHSGCNESVRIDEYENHVKTCLLMTNKKNEEIIYEFVVNEIKTSPNGTVRVKTSGQPIYLTPTTMPRKELVDAAKSTRRKRKSSVIGFMNVQAGSSNSQEEMKMSVMKSSTQSERDELLKEMGLKSSIDASGGLAMMFGVGITWNKYRELSRWMRMFNMRCPSEKLMREVCKEKIITHADIQTEMTPFTSIDKKKVVLKTAPMSRVVNLKEMVFKRLDDLDRLKLFKEHSFLNDEIHVKIGGDHGGGSFKQCFQICNVEHPNSVENTICFCIFEAKDRKANLKLALNVFRNDVNDLQKSMWCNKKIRVFMYGDYAYLSEMYGLSGASGKYPCLWCSIKNKDMKLPAGKRECVSSRTLENLEENLKLFNETYGGNVKFAKECINVIDDRYFDIPLDQVVPPGLHLTLGITLKIYNEFEKDCKRLDFKLNSFEEQSEEFEHIMNITDYISSLEEALLSCQELYNWRMYHATSEEESANLTQLYNIHVQKVEDQIDRKKLELMKYEQTHELSEIGPVYSGSKEYLQDIHVQRQAFHCNSFNGNHCHTLLKPSKFKPLLSLPKKVLADLNCCCTTIVAEAQKMEKKYDELFTLFSRCHNLMNTKGDVDVILLDSTIKQFMNCWREGWKFETVPPKFHILENHVAQFISKWKVGLGFYGEQGGESIHAYFNKLNRTYGGMNSNPAGRLHAILCAQHRQTHPEILAMKPEIIRRSKKLDS